ncbi:hypothetical protein DFR30_1848 [Thiogranum longum]|uniref:Sel1 repeat-containing protein n=1 Tax=Thiogranum longum TaxID=1537524 RepID=A0A4R1HGU3_9GAMM|nr:tetratricopeptide repeat protein [Thiogranum longum]TCK18569.1 hypothetical protein DFR30_1848 [Thiogranum longum]
MQRVVPQYFIGMLILGGLLIGCASQQTQPDPEVQKLIAKAESGDTEAQFKLGAAYDYGKGVRSDGNEAKKWYRKAAEAGHAEAQNSLGSGYQADKQYEEAIIWYEKAAKQNHALATNNLGYLHDLGLGVPKDRQKGYALYLRAAELGWAESMFNLGQMYGSGQLGQADMVKGCMWAIRALKYSKHGRVKEQAAGTVKYCKQTLSTEDYKKAEQDANSWSPQSALR